MDIGNQIKNYRENLKISQEELADRVFVSRQTISNWENNKNYPDIKSLLLLSNIFEVSLDQLVKGDVEEMKRIISESNVKEFSILANIYSIQLVILAVSAYPLLKYLNIIGIVIWGIIFVITMAFAIKIEKLKKQYDIQSYREIVAFIEGKTLDEAHKNQEIGKRGYQKFLLTIGCGIITFLLVIIIAKILG